MSLSFLTPTAGLVGLVGVLALLVLRAALRRSDALCAVLGLAPDRRHRTLRESLPLVAIALLLAFAAAQPVVSTRQAREGRQGVEVITVVDVTRSMLARRSPSEPTRLDRARKLSKHVRAQLTDVEFGLASITDRVLPHLFPTLSLNSYAATIDRAIGIERPPPDRPPVGQVSRAPPTEGRRMSRRRLPLAARTGRPWRASGPVGSSSTVLPVAPPRRRRRPGRA